MTAYPDYLTSLTPLEAVQALHDLAAKTPKTQAIVEIGVYRGRTTCWLAAGAQSGKGAHVYGIDPWDLPEHEPFKPKFAMSKQREIAEAYVAETGHADHVTYIQDFSTEVARTWHHGGKVGLLYVDGDHCYDGVLADWAAWSPHLARGAVVVWDDYGHPSHPDVKRAVDTLVEAGHVTAPDVVGPRTAITRYRQVRSAMPTTDTTTDTTHA